MTTPEQISHTHRGLGEHISSYPQCTGTMTKAFSDNLSTASGGCKALASYVWDGYDNPTEVQRKDMCNCNVSDFSVPKCYWLKLNQYEMDTILHFGYVYDCFNINGKKTPAMVEVEAKIYTPTTSSATPTLTPTSTPTRTPTMTPTVMPAVETVNSTDANPTNPPTGAAKNLSDCSSQQLNAFSEQLYTASNQCMGGSSSSYNWGGRSNPTDAQYEQICKCEKVAVFSIPNCSIQKGPDIVSLPEHYVWVTKTECEKKPVSEPSSNIGMIAGIAGGVVVVVLVVGFLLFKRHKKSKQDQRPYQVEMHAAPSPMIYHPVAVTPEYARPRKSTDARQSQVSDGSRSTVTTVDGSFRPSATGSLGVKVGVPVAGAVAWDDPAITAVRIPYDSIFLGPLLSRGGFGEVYRGTYRGETVAIKQLLPARRKDLAQIDYFLGEVKLMSSLEHERIVKFIGVAWNSLSDACLVVEFMENGDLRSVLTRWDEGAEKRMNGFDKEKVKIAMHIAHALVYLHSLQPVVVHRDLKSKNILLDGNMDAKLMDFGISRERADSTMTAGVGSSLWMAPEVMMGNRYDEKADIFSFGVVLSELDTHQLPYFQARTAESGQRVPEAAILQQVMLGRVVVGFTDRANGELVRLGRECVSLDPKARPTTAMVLHRVHQVMRKYK